MGFIKMLYLIGQWLVLNKIQKVNSYLCVPGQQPLLGFNEVFQNTLKNKNVKKEKYDKNTRYKF